MGLKCFEKEDHLLIMFQFFLWFFINLKSDIKVKLEFYEINQSNLICIDLKC